ncbi:MAG: class I SAM-dependent methyltransferase [Thermomicrobiales bacterium]
MRDYLPMDSFGADSAAVYDDQLRGDETETVDFLQELAGSGPVLELAIGTGRIALPLAQRGVRVDGIDLSEAMVARLRLKPGGDELSVVIGDFADVPIEGEYRLIYVVYNTFHNLLTQDDQVRCFENVAKHLSPDGCFLIEAGLPSEYFGKGNTEYVKIDALEKNVVALDVAQYDLATQILTENHLSISEGGLRFAPIVTRFCWPSELDLMARIAGLQLRDRWSGWKREPFDARSVMHVSVFGR